MYKRQVLGNAEQGVEVEGLELALPDYLGVLNPAVYHVVVHERGGDGAQVVGLSLIHIFQPGELSEKSPFTRTPAAFSRSTTAGAASVTPGLCAAMGSTTTCLLYTSRCV